MCFLVDDDESEETNKSGKPKLQMKRHHTWLIPRRGLMVIFGVAFIMCILGMIFMAIGGGIGSTGLRITGGILFALSIIGMLVCLVVCLYAYFVYGTKDQSIQTEMSWADEYMTDGAGYASIGRPSALKSADSTLKRNGLAGQKKVTMAPEVGPYGESPPDANLGGNVDSRLRTQIVKSPSSGSGGVGFGEVSDPRGVGGRTVVGGDVGTGGIRVTTLERNQPFPSPGSQVSSGVGQSYSGYGGVQAGYAAEPGQVIYSGGGSSVSSSVDGTYAYPRSVSVRGGPESGFNEPASESQYSTLRSIPVTHLVTDSQRQQQDSVEYARIHKQSKNAQAVSADFPQQRGYLVQGQVHSQGQSHSQVQGQGYSQGQGHSQVQGQGYSQGQGHSQVQGQGYSQIQGQYSQYDQRFPVTDDFDYDNPVERTPMISPQRHQLHSPSYHEQQMQYQRQQHREDLHAPRQLNIHSLQRQTASNPYHQLQQESQQMQYQSSNSASHDVTNDGDLPDLQPLVYPSARRPMTFEQVSSSKMSVYDNVLAGLKDIDD